MMRLARLPAYFGLGASLAACSTGARAASGTGAFMQVPGAEFVSGPMPSGSVKGPGVAQVSLMNDNIWPGLVNDPIMGALAPTATAAAIGLQGDLGYWLVVAGIPNVATPNDPSFSVAAAFSNGIVPGDYALVVRAVDDAGHFGPPRTQILVAEPSPTNPPPAGDLVVTLTWDTDSSLDLHVVQPNGPEIYWGNPSSQPPPPFETGDSGSYGYIDYDSNANCVIDGFRREDAIWPGMPPSGQYTVRVDAASLCGEPIAHWSVAVRLRGAEIASARGVALDAETMGTHGIGAGVLALEFAVP